MSSIPDALRIAREQAAALEYNLTEAWTPLDHHEIQASLVYHPARLKFCPAARRSGKTTLAKRDGILESLADRSWAARIGFTAPTYSRAKDIFLDDLENLIPREWIKRFRQSIQSMEFEFVWGAKLRIFGMSNPKTVEGVPWDKLYIDEIADCPADCVESNILPALETKGRIGKAWFIGVPDEVGDNQIEYERYWELGLRWPEDIDVCSFWWPASDILSAEQIEKMAERMDEMRFRQEMRGEFIRSSGRAFPTFSVGAHVDSEMCEYSPFLPVDHCIDFGSRTGASLIAQNYRGSVWVMDEIVLDGSSTDVAGRTFLERCREHGYLLNRVGVYGDAAGRTPGSTTGATDYEILREEYSGIYVEWNQLIANPPIRDTVNIVRRQLLSRAGAVNLYIHPRCEVLIQNMKDADWPAKNNLREFHPLAALRYYLFKLFGDVERGIISTSTAQLTSAADQRRFSSRYSG